MSSKVYFSNGQHGWRQRLVHSTLNFSARVMPHWTRSKVGNMLMSPVKTAVAATPDITTSSMTTREGEICLYETGQGPCILLVHGWSGSAEQFFPLMQALAKSGYRALAYDQVAHGRSSGKHAHLPRFMATLEDVLEKHPEIHGFVAHSMGTVALLEQLPSHYQQKPVALIAPTFRFFEVFQQRVTAAGIPDPLFHHLLNSIASEYQLNFAQIGLEKSLTKRLGSTLILHDKKDRFARYEHSLEASQQHDGCTLVSTEGLGHARLLRDENVINTVVAHMQAA